MRILVKFVSSSAIVVGLIACLIVGSDYWLNRVEQSAQESYEKTSQTIPKILRLEILLNEQVVALKDYLVLNQNGKDLIRYREAKYDFILTLNTLKEFLLDDRNLKEIQQTHQTLINLETNLLQNASSHSFSKADLYQINETKTTIGLYLDVLTDYVQEQYRLARSQATQSHRKVNQIRKASFILIVFLFAGQFILIFLPVVRSIYQLKLGTETIGSGDLNYRLQLQTGDEIEQLAHQFNLMTSRLAESYRSLEQKVIERTQSLENEILERQQTEVELNRTLQELQQTQVQLIQTEKMSSLGQLVAGIAHEVNNPVSFIHGNLTHADAYMQHLLEIIQLYQQCYPQPNPIIQEKMADVDFDFLTEDLTKLFNSMRDGTDRIRQIVLSLRNFSRLDEAKMKIVDLHEGLESTLLILQNRLKARTISVANQTYWLPAIEITKNYGKLPPVECYAGQLNQVFMNIIANAIDAIEERAKHEKFKEINDSQITSGEIIIQTKLNSSDRVEIAITDNGSGMAESVQSRLFDPFFTTKPIGQGTGLGLSISYQIIQKHGGLLQCKSQPNNGTTFWIEIPIRRTDKPPTPNVIKTEEWVEDWMDGWGK